MGRFHPVKFLLLFFITAGFLQVEAQELTIDLEDTTVESVFSYIRSQTDVDFVFNNEEVAKLPRVTINASEATVETVLDICLTGTGLTHKRVNNTFIITPVEETPEGKLKRKRAQTLRGTVIDADSRYPLPFATVVVMSPYGRQGTSTDAYGNFRFERLSVGRYLLRVSYIGYKDAIVSELSLGSAKETVLNIPITENRETIEEIEINYTKGSPLNQMTSVSSLSFSVKETKRYPVSLSDPARMVQVFAGVTNTDDATNEIVIRGNSPNWLQWRLEGIEIPSPNHFAEEGFLAGAVSILSTNLIGLSDFFTGAFPAEYGNALSGVFDLRLRNGNNEKREYAFQAGLLGLDISAEGPFKEGYTGSYLFNYRYSTFSVLNAFDINISQNALPNYQDLSFKLHLPTKKAGSFSIWGLGGMAYDNEIFEPDTTEGQELEWGYRDFTRSGMYATGISHTYFPNNRSYIKTTIASTANYSAETYEISDSLGTMHTTYEDNLSNNAFRISTLYNNKLSSAFTFRLGMTFSQLYYHYMINIDNSILFPSAILNSGGNTQMLQSYIQGKYKPGEKLTVNGGLHVVYFRLSNHASLEPRFGFRYTLRNDQVLSFGYGLHSRHENLPVYFAGIKDPAGGIYLPNTSLDLTKAHHLVAGYEKMILSDVKLKTETYFQYIYDLPVPDNPDKYWAPFFGGVNLGDTLANIGKARNYGLELTVQKFFTPDFYFVYSSSLFDAKYKPADGNWYNTRYNLGFIHNLVGGKEFDWGDDKLLGINLRLIWAGGKRYNPIDLQRSIQAGYGIPSYDNPFNYKAKNYFRIDLGLKFHFYGKSAEHIFFLDIQNLTNRVNVLLEDYNPVTQGTIDYPMTGLIPIFNYRVEF